MTFDRDRALVRAVWIHQLDSIRNDVDWLFNTELSQQYCPEYYLKALDAADYMNAFDRHPNAVSRASGGPGWTWRQKHIVPWTVPTGRYPASEEGRLTRLIRRRASEIILDLEPYARFWQGTEEDWRQFSLSATGGYSITLDYRRLPAFPYPAMLDRCSRLLPQVYWTTFRRPMFDVLDEARALIAPLGKDIEWVLPADASDDDFQTALYWVKQNNEQCSIWLWETMNAVKWDMIQRANQETG